MLKLGIVLITFITFLLFTPAAFTNSHIMLNEFASDVASGEKEWVEFYNPGSTDQSLSGWFIEERTGSDLFGVSSYTLDSIGVPAGGFAVYEFSGSKLNNGGDIVTLKNGSTKVDEVAYGSAPNSQVDAPAKGQSAGRKTDGSSTWVIFDSFTKGQSNSSGQAAVESSPSPSPSSTAKQSSSTQKSPSPSPKSSPAKSPSPTPKPQSAILGEKSNGQEASPSLLSSLGSSPSPSPTPLVNQSPTRAKIAALLVGSGAVLIGLALGSYFWFRRILAKSPPQDKEGSGL